MKERKKRFLSLIISLVMLATSVFGQAEYAAATEPTIEYKQVTSASEITAGGRFVLVAENAGTYYAFDAVTSGKKEGKTVTVTGDVLTATDIPVWTIAANDTGVSLHNGSKYLGYNTSGTDFSSKDAAYTWNVTESNGTFRFLATTGSNRAVACQTSSSKFGSYATTNKTGYVFDLLVFKETVKVAEEEGTCARVKASVSGGAVQTGTEVTLLCETEGATIYVDLTNAGNFQEYDGTPIVINEDKTITAYASLNGLKDSEHVTFTYTIVVPTCAAVTASPSAGRMEAGKTVALSTSTEGASIFYSTDATATKESFVLYENPIVISEDTTIYAFAKCEGYTDSDIVSIAYTVRKLATPLNTGDKVAVFSVNNNVLLTNVVNGTKLEGAAAETTADGKLKTESDAVVFLEVSYDEATGYYTFVADGKYLTSGATGNGLSFEENASDYSVWQIYEAADAGKYLIKNVNASYNGNAQYVEYYKTFTTYGLTATASEKAYVLSFHTEDQIEVVVPGDENPENPGTPEIPETPENPNKVVATYTDTLKDGNVVVVYYPTSGKLLSKTESEYNGKKQFAGTSATATDGKMEVPEDAMLLTVSIAEDGTITFISEDNKYLTSGSTGSTLTLENADGLYSQWELEKVDNGYRLKNKNAAYYGSAQYIRYISAFYTYSFKEDNANQFVMQFYKVKEGTPSLKYDTSFTGTVAQWAGGMNNTDGVYNTAKVLYGDKYDAADELDGNSTLTVVLKGQNAVVYTDPNKASSNHYVGASGFGAGDYIQLQTSTLGYGNMNLSFRLRVTNAAPAEYTVQYSTDGATFYNFASGTYDAKYTPYNGSEQQYNGVVTNGILKFTSAVAKEGAYVNFNLDVPSNAVNAENLYIRIVGGETRANGADGTPNGNLRIDTITIKGNPILSSEFTKYVVATPSTGEALLGQELTLTTATVGADIYYAFKGEEFKLYDAANKPVFQQLPTAFEAYAIKDGKQSIVTRYTYTQAKCEMIKATPNGGAVATGSKVTLRCNTEGAKIMYAFDTGATELTWLEYSEPFALDTLPAIVKVKAVKEGFLDGEVSTLTFAQRENEKYNIYFGQLHAHTNYSDGAGTVEQAFQHAREVANLDFLAVTDHSNSFDEADKAVISQNMDTVATNEWTMGHTLAEQYSTDDFTCLYGYEMTWSNGLGHMNTFNTPGYQSRTQSAYTNYATALQNYYAALTTVPDSISMFNHPGTTFGDFSDFSYWTEQMDTLIALIEVGNGEGAIGSSGYFPSYEYYTRALDKGWHVSPTNNQDNHKGMWGDANTARSVVLADKNTEEHIYDAMRNNRMYATEDNNLSIYYTLDGYIMGTVLAKDQVSDKVKLVVELSDADATDAIGRVEVIVNGGISAASKTVTTNAETVTFEIPTNYSYYYIKVTEADGDIAVTSPVWVGNVEACGINNTYTDSLLAVSGEPVDVNVDFFNNETADLVVDSIEVKLDGEVVHRSTADTLANAGVSVIKSKSTGVYSFEYTHNGVGTAIYEIVVNATLDGVQKLYTDKIEFSYTVKELVTKVIIDGSHYNDYVTGYYGGGMGPFIEICAGKSIEAVIDTDGITAEDLEDCALLVISAPAKKAGTLDDGSSYVVSHFEDSFIALVKEYVAKGGSVIVCGLADYQDRAACQTATEQNKLLAAIGATIRLNSDQAQDAVNNGGQAYRLYPEIINKDSKWLAGVVDKQVYSAYSGCTVNIDNAVENDVVYAAEWLVKGFETTNSVNTKTDTGSSAGNEVVVEAGNVIFAAAQQTKAGGNIFVAGTVFMSSFEVKAEMDNSDSLPYINYNIIKNILSDVEKELNVSSIAEARKGNLKDLFAVEGYVTSGTSNEYTTFFDSIYIQDETGGICVFPFAEAGLEIGTKMKITGFIEEYQGEREIQVISYQILDAEKKCYEPKEITTAQATDYDTFGGQLVKVTGTVTRVDYTTDGKGVAEYWVKDASGVEAAVFIDGYILSGTTGTNTLASSVKVGDTVSGCGVLYKHPEGESDVSVPVLRVRNCDEIVRIKEATNNTPSNPGTVTPPAQPEAEEVPAPSAPVTPVVPENDKEPSVTKEPTTEEIKETTLIFTEVESVKEILADILNTINNVKDDQTVTVKLSGSDKNKADVSIEVFDALAKNKDKNIDLVIELSNGLSWTINSNSVESEKWSDGVATIDLYAEIVKDVIPADAIASVVEKDQESFELSLRHNGDFGFVAELEIPVGTQYAGKEITLFYFNPETKELEKQATEVVDEFGTIKFIFTHASDYVLVIEQEQENVSVEMEKHEPIEAPKTEVQLPAEKEGGFAMPILIILAVIAIASFAYVYMSMKRKSQEDR